MKKLTVFTAPKPFVDPHINTIQRNAIRSWLQMGSDVEILLIGNEDGVAKAASNLHVEHLPGVKTNTHGTPLVSSIFQLARERGDADVFLFTNTDMIFLSDVLDVALQTKQRANDFVLLGQRHDLVVETDIDFASNWKENLENDLNSKGKLHPLGGSDYFVFPSHLFSHIPDFAIGRAGWDNWMIFHAIEQRWLVVDATPSVIAIHQNHDYGHLESERGHQRHPETEENLNLAGGMRKMYSLLDVKFQLVNGEILPVPGSATRFLHRLERQLQPDTMVGRGPRWWLLRGIRKLRRAMQKLEVN